MSIRITNLFMPFLSIFSLGIFFFSNSMVGQQDTLYYDTNWKSTVKDSAAYFRPPVSKVGDLYKKEDYYISGKLQMSALSSRPDKDIWEGKVTWYNEDGTVLQEGTYKNNRLDGEYVSTLNGKKLKAKFESGRMVSGKTNGKLNNNRQYYTEMRGDTILNIIYENDIKGVRYERYSVGRKYDVLVKYFDVNGELLGQKESLGNGEILGMVVTYYKKPMRPLEIAYYPNGQKLGSTVFYCKDQVREEFNTENELSKTFYDTDGNIMGKMTYTYENKYLKPVDGVEYKFYSSYKEYKAELIRSITEYRTGKLVKEQRFYENQNPSSTTYYTAGAKNLQISYNEAGVEIARMVYDNWAPKDGVEIIGNRKTVYKDGKLIEEINNYYDTDIVFSKKTTAKETFYDKKGKVLGTLELQDKGGYSKPMTGTRYFLDAEGDIQSIELYKEGYLAERTSFRKRQVGKDETDVFKKIEKYKPNSFTRDKTIRFYSNGKKQSEISFDGYSESTGIFYDKQENLLGEYYYKTKEGTLYEFFGDSDALKRKEIRKDGKQLLLKRYDYGPKSEYGEINPVLVEDFDVSCCAMSYTRDGELIAKVSFREGKPWEGQYYDVISRKRYTLKDGEQNGLYEKLDYNQAVLERGNYVSNKKEGLFSYYNYNGQLLKTENYKNDVLEGIANYYSDNGEIKWEMLFKGGEPWNGTRVTSPGYAKNEQTETYQNGQLTKRISFDDNGKRVTNFKNGQETESTAYHGDTNVRRLTYSVKNNVLDGTVTRYDKQGKVLDEALFDKGRLKEGTVFLTAGNVRGNPDHLILTRKQDSLEVKFVGKTGKILFTAQENLAFGTATVFMQNLEIYMDYLAPSSLY